MQIQFGILPSAVGAPGEYGTIKAHALPTLFKLRKIRDEVVHPKGMFDLAGIDLQSLEGKDINSAMIEFLRTFSNIITKCSRILIPPENRDRANLASWMKEPL